jgi:hypothetical protein
LQLTSKNSSNDLLWLILLLFVVAVLLVFAFLRRKNISAKVILPIVVVGMTFGTAALPLHQAKADTFCTAGYHLWDAGDGQGVPWWDDCLYLYTVNIDSDSYAPNATIEVTGMVQTSMCANEIAGGFNESRSKIEATAPYSGEQHVLTEGSPDADTTQDNPEQNECLNTHSCFGGSMFGDAQFTAPSQAGSYIIHFLGTGWYTAGGDETSNSGTADLPFTVTGPVCAANTGSTCHSTANECGQTTSGSVQCDGGCSAPSPVQCCPAGKVLGSGGTCVPATCPTGQTFNSSGVCVPIICPTGQTLNSSGTCVPIVCPTGQALNSSGACVPITCPAGQTLNSSGVCITTSCPTGQVLNSNGVCIPNNCPANQTMNANGVCVAGSCPSGQVLNGSGTCVAPNCPTGQVANSNGVCVPTTSCPTGQTLNASNVCVPIVCPSGLILNSSGVCVANNSCVANAGQTCASVGNSCGMTNIGVTNCDGSCSVSMPANSLCSGGSSDPTLSLVASPNRVRTGTATLLSWNATNVRSCTVTGTNGFSSNLTSGTNVNSQVITTATVFTFTCTNNSGVTSSISQTVQPLPVFNEQ